MPAQAPPMPSRPRPHSSPGPPTAPAPRGSSPREEPRGVGLAPPQRPGPSVCLSGALAVVPRAPGSPARSTTRLAVHTGAEPRASRLDPESLTKFSSPNLHLPLPSPRLIPSNHSCSQLRLSLQGPCGVPGGSSIGSSHPPGPLGVRLAGRPLPPLTAAGPWWPCKLTVEPGVLGHAGPAPSPPSPDHRAPSSPRLCLPSSLPS